MPLDPGRLKTRRRDPGSLLASQIEELSGNRTRVTLKRQRPWASITFAGTRHSFAIDWANGAERGKIEHLARTLPDHEFAVPGHFVADLLITEQSDTRLLVEALTIIDPVEDTRD